MILEDKPPEYTPSPRFSTTPLPQHSPPLLQLHSPPSDPSSLPQIGIQWSSSPPSRQSLSPLPLHSQLLQMGPQRSPSPLSRQSPLPQQSPHSQMGPQRSPSPQPIPSGIRAEIHKMGIIMNKVDLIRLLTYFLNHKDKPLASIERRYSDYYHSIMRSPDDLPSIFDEKVVGQGALVSLGPGGHLNLPSLYPTHMTRSSSQQSQINEDVSSETIARAKDTLRNALDSKQSLRLLPDAGVEILSAGILTRQESCKLLIKLYIVYYFNIHGKNLSATDLQDVLERNEIKDLFVFSLRKHKDITGWSNTIKKNVVIVYQHMKRHECIDV